MHAWQKTPRRHFIYATGVAGRANLEDGRYHWHILQHIVIPNIARVLHQVEEGIVGPWQSTAIGETRNWNGC